MDVVPASVVCEHHGTADQIHLGGVLVLGAGRDMDQPCAGASRKVEALWFFRPGGISLHERAVRVFPAKTSVRVVVVVRGGAIKGDAAGPGVAQRAPFEIVSLLDDISQRGGKSSSKEGERSVFFQELIHDKWTHLKELRRFEPSRCH